MKKQPVITNKELRHFGWAGAFFFLGLFGVGIPWLKSQPFRPWPSAIGTLFLLGSLWPPALKPIYPLFMKFGHVAGWINSRIILGIFYYLAFVPTALILKLKGWDPMERRIDKKKVSYRVPRLYDDVSLGKAMERPY